MNYMFLSQLYEKRLIMFSNFDQITFDSERTEYLLSNSCLRRIFNFCNYVNIFRNLLRYIYLESKRYINSRFYALLHNTIAPLMLGFQIVWGVGYGCENEIIDQGRSYFEQNIDISNCFFSRNIQYSGNGGVVYVNGGSYSMNINYTMFYNCVSSGDGGAIYFISTNSLIKMICANCCSVSSLYHFAFIQVSEINHVEHLSVSNCSHSPSGSHSIFLYTGEQKVDSTNSSINIAKQVSGICIWLPSSFTGSYCTFSNNKVSDYICTWFYYAYGTMSYANIVHNNSPNYGVIYCDGPGSMKMTYCIFQNNQNYLFCLWSGSLEVSHSFIDHSGSSFSTKTAVSQTNNSLTNMMTYQIQFFNSHHCNADIPLSDKAPIKTIEISPMSSFEETLTIGTSQNETIPRTYVELICTDRMGNFKGIGVIFSIMNSMIILV